jgi:integrase
VHPGANARVRAAIGCCAWCAKGARKAKIPLPRRPWGPWRPTWLPARSGPGRCQGHLWELVRRLARLARIAGIGAWEQLSPHSLRHSAITFALDAGAPLWGVQDYAGRNDPRTTRPYDHSRDSLDRNAAYTVAAYLA